jgi:hypothetical protein
MEPEISIAFSQMRATGSYPQSHESTPQLHYSFYRRASLSQVISPIQGFFLQFYTHVK